MTKFFLKIFDFFEKRQRLMWASLLISVALFAVFALQLRLHTDITKFLPNQNGSQNSEILANLRIKDRIIVMFSAETADISPDDLISAAETFETEIWQQTDSAHILNLDAVADLSIVDRSFDFIYQNLPFFLQASDYQRIDSLLQPKNFADLMNENYQLMLSPMSVGLGDVVARDPLLMAKSALGKLQNFNQFDDYALYDDRLFSADFRTLFLFIDSHDGSNVSPLNDELTSAIEHSLEKVAVSHQNVAAECYGVPIIAAYNARQIQRDLMVTLNVALLIIVLLILLAFGRKRTVLLLVVPVLYGALFAAAVVFLVQGEISAIAIGTASVVLGVALSYSVHVVAHAGHSFSARQIVRELAYPLTIGGITTIGAFVGLLFTSSPLLQDFGIFAASTLVGTTLFCLIFLPHFISADGNRPKRRVLNYIERFTSYAYDRNRWLLAGLTVALLVSLFVCNGVKFNYDMMQFYYRPQHLESAGNRLESRPDEDKSVLLVSQSLADYFLTDSLLNVSQSVGKVDKFMSAAYFLPPIGVQTERLQAWNAFWTPEKRSQLQKLFSSAQTDFGFQSDAFAGFWQLLNHEFQSQNLLNSVTESSLAFSSLIEQNDSNSYLMSQVWLPEANKSELYNQISDRAVVVDQSYFIGEVARGINNDFNLILLISSLLIFVVLLFSYGRLELALLAFMPMFVSWFVILGAMAIFGIEFNIINIILATFIFGIGDDFSIFVLDGLVSERRDGIKTLESHKLAIFFSALMTVIGMGALLFARHPAVHSLALVSLLGIVVVVLVAFVLQPFLFRWIYSDLLDPNFSQPKSLKSFFKSAVQLFSALIAWLTIVFGILFVLILPCTKAKKRQFVTKILKFISLIFPQKIFSETENQPLVSRILESFENGNALNISTLSQSRTLLFCLISWLFDFGNNR